MLPAQTCGTSRNTSSVKRVSLAKLKIGHREVNVTCKKIPIP